MDKRPLRDDQHRQHIADFASLFTELVQPVRYDFFTTERDHDALIAGLRALWRAGIRFWEQTDRVSVEFPCEEFAEEFLAIHLERFGSLPSYRAGTSGEEGVEPGPPGSCLGNRAD